MVDLKNYAPFETYFQGRLWWKSSFLRFTKGQTKVEDIITLVNVPTFIWEHALDLTTADFSHIPTQPNLNIIIPAKYVDESGEIFTVEFAPNKHIFIGDIVYIHGFPFIASVQSLNNPLTLFSHYEIVAVPTPHSFNFLSAPPIPHSSMSYIEPPADILPETVELVNYILQNQIVV